MFQKGHKINVGRKRPKHSEKMKKLYREGKLGIYRKSEDFTDEDKKKISEAGKGRIAWNKGLKGIKTGPPKGFKPWNTGKHLSKEIKEKISKNRMGKGVNPNKVNYNGWDLQLWSRAVLNRDKKCMGCGTKKNLEAHHILPKAIYPKKVYDIENGITLCKKCHKKTETYGRKLGCKDETIVRTCG